MQLFLSLEYLLSVFCQRTGSKSYSNSFCFLCMLLIWNKICFISFYLDAVWSWPILFLWFHFWICKVLMVQKSNHIKSWTQGFLTHRAVTLIPLPLTLSGWWFLLAWFILPRFLSTKIASAHIAFWFLFLPYKIVEYETLFAPYVFT